jgi:hypothetical protein
LNATSSEILIRVISLQPTPFYRGRLGSKGFYDIPCEKI